MSEKEDNAGSVGVAETQIVKIPLPPEGLKLECGDALPELHVAYEAYGNLSENRANAVFLCHALSGSAHVAGRHEPPDDTEPWWDEMVGPGKGIDTRYYYVICANILGGCKGTTGPSSVDPRTGRPYGSAFPHITVGDIVEVHRLLLKHLGIERLAGVIGGSFGGMQAMEWAIRRPEMIERCICIASAASLSAQALSFDIIGRKAITADPHWQSGDYYETGSKPERGLSLARKIGHITYLSPEMMTRKFGREKRDVSPEEQRLLHTAAAGFRSAFQVESYLDHQGKKFVKRFDANSYLHITRAMDEYDLAERFESLEQAFEPVLGKMLIVALSSDWLFPPEQSMTLATSLLRAGKDVSYCELHAPHGHDAFLVDIEHLAEAIRAFLPWVQTHPEGGDAECGAREPSGANREYSLMTEVIEEGSRVLDVGCGDGDLLTLLSDRRRVRGLGVDIDIGHVINVIDRGHDIFQADIDAGLAMIPDNAYDYAILSQTLQVVRRPRFVLQEMLRVAREGIVSFPNFGKWSLRLQLWRTGRMPRGGSLPFPWYETPNIHLFTLRDFIDLCEQDGLLVQDVVCISDDLLGRWLIRLGLCNAGADRVLVRLSRAEGGKASERKCCRVVRNGKADAPGGRRMLCGLTTN